MPTRAEPTNQVLNRGSWHDSRLGFTNWLLIPWCIICLYMREDINLVLLRNKIVYIRLYRITRCCLQACWVSNLKILISRRGAELFDRQSLGLQPNFGLNEESDSSWNGMIPELRSVHWYNLKKKSVGGYIACLTWMRITCKNQLEWYCWSESISIK